MVLAVEAELSAEIKGAIAGRSRCKWKKSSDIPI
jgi:hypothetical protein